MGNLHIPHSKKSNSETEIPEKIVRQVFLAILIDQYRTFFIKPVLSLFNIKGYTLKRDRHDLEKAGVMTGYIFSGNEFTRDERKDTGYQGPGKYYSPDDPKIRRLVRIFDLYREIHDSIESYLNKDTDLLLTYYDYLYFDPSEYECSPQDFREIQAHDFFTKNTPPAKKREIQRDLLVLKKAATLLRDHYHELGL